MFKQHSLRGASLALALAATLAGCGGGGSGPSGGGSSGGASTSGTVSVALVDAPAPDVSALNITIDRVEAHVTNRGDLNDNDDRNWKAISSVPQSFDLLDLRTNEAILGSTNLPVGSYQQIRLFPSNATVTDSTGTHPVTIPSASNTGIKLNVNYPISADQITTILLDFNISKSLIKTGNGRYQLKPVIPAVIKVLSGTVTGTVSDGSAGLEGADVEAIYVSGDKYASGTSVNNSISDGDGSFKIWALLPGTYDLKVTLADGTTFTKTGVVVTADSNTAVGTLSAPTS